MTFSRERATIDAVDSVSMAETSNESVVAIESTLDDVDRALERLRLGTYRECQVCAATIDESALEANPLLANCAAHPELS
jgi:RNA polymerase-binding transcription factor DksA